MNPIESYARALRPLTQPYLAMMHAYAGLLSQMGGAKLPAPVSKAAENASPSPVVIISEPASGRAQAFAVVRDVAKKEFSLDIELKRKSSAEKAGITHSAAVERAKRSWATRRANVALEEKAARKAARQKARARKAR